MNTVLFLILFPLAMAALLFVAGGSTAARGFLVKLGAAVMAVASYLLLGPELRGETSFFALHLPALDTVVLGLDLLVTLVLLWFGLRARQLIVVLLVAAQGLLMGLAEFGGTHAHAVAEPLFIDPFSMIMAHIVGVIGGLICLHAVGYMKAYHAHHPEAPGGQRKFFAIIFLFLGAMFGVIFANHVGWLFLCWEVTTLCSFLLIGYSGTPEARQNAFLALRLNLIGGVAFAGAILYQVRTGGSLALNEMIASGPAVLIPVLLICVAGLTKAAQMPFSAWLLGAMVAPTPVSALLHSSTMVKAGVYVIVRFAPVLQGTTAGLLLALIGATTFLLASGIAISQSNAKRVLAYSTIANLGLIITCAGVGNPQAVWAAILLIIFHAVAKALLFIAVGSAEHSIGSRDIEDMEGLIKRRPKTALAILIGIAGMFLAPFGMLISKWAAIEALMESHPILPVMVAFGSSATLFFWAKWMGKILSTVKGTPPPHGPVSNEEKMAMLGLGILTVGLCACWPLISSISIKPFLLANYGEAVELNRATVIIMSIMLALVAALPLSLLYKGEKKLRLTTPTWAAPTYRNAISSPPPSAIPRRWPSATTT
jgi:ech hydrogenase subunit A